MTTIHARSDAAPRAYATLLAALSAVGPFSVDAYLPAMPEIGRTLGASPELVQQTLTAYMVPYAVMTLWHGAISDALGRRRVVLWSTAAYVVVTALAFSARSIEMLLLCRALQGVTAGAGMVVGRAIVRDRFEGAAAQRLMSQVSLTFAIAPAIAPVIGGWLQEAFGWRAVFGFLAAYGALMWWLCFRRLDETLPKEKRQPLHPAYLLRSYLGVLKSVRFLALSLASTFGFMAFFIYVAGAPVFMIEHLKVPSTQLIWLFGPITAGLAVGAVFSGKLAGRWSRGRQLGWAFGTMGVAAALNIVLSYTIEPRVPWSVVPLFIFVCGTAMAFPTLSLAALDEFPTKRGLASSCTSFLQSAGGALVAWKVAAVWGSVRTLAWTQLAILAAGALMVWVARAVPRRVTAASA